VEKCRKPGQLGIEKEMIRAIFFGMGVCAFTGLNPAQAAKCRSDVPVGMTLVPSSNVWLAYKVVNGPVRVGKPFGLEIMACLKKAGSAALRMHVDATMPAHGHGMNYKPMEKKVGPGHSRFKGFVFHMPGRWQFSFDAFGTEKRHRTTVSITVSK
jgi:hypothetical protein